MSGEGMRKKGVDLCKVIALLLVFLQHYAGYTHFREEREGIVFYSLLTVWRQFSIICVPLFFIITGFVSSSVQNVKNYKKAQEAFNVYIFYSMVMIWISISQNKEIYSLKSLISSMSAVNAGTIGGREWYVRYYILLLFFMPFFNELWNVLTKKRKKHLLILLIIITVLPQSIYGMFGIVTFTMNVSNMIFGVTYFFVGKYIAEYGVGIKKKQLAAILCMTLAAVSVFYGIVYLSRPANDSTGRISTALIAVSLFGLLYDIDMSNKIHTFIRWCAGASLDTYLGALALEFLLFNRELSGKAFFIENLKWLPVVIAVLIVWGNIRTVISKHMFGGGYSFVKRGILTFIMLGIICASVLFAKYEYLPEDLLVQNGVVNEEGVAATDQGCVTAGPFVNLTPGIWIAEIYYEAAVEGNYADASYYDQDGEIVQYASWNLEKGRTCKKIELSVLEGTVNWEVRTFYNGTGEMIVEKILLYRLVN